MTILDELLATIQKSDVDEQLKIICDQISKEEIHDLVLYEGPTGANIFLSLPVHCADEKYENYICLEREAQSKYIISHWNCLRSNELAIPKRIKAWDVKQDAPKKILKDFAERMSYLKGE